MLTIPPKRPVRFFNTTGPCNPWDHYMLPPMDRLVGAQLDRYIRDNLYWELYAPRQTGKTTFLQYWAREINSGDEAVACYVSIERCQKLPEPERCIPELCKAIQEYAGFSNLPVPESKTNFPNSMLKETYLDSLAARIQEPAVRKVMESFITGTPDPGLTKSEGFCTCMDLGLVKMERYTITAANPIYEEALARRLTYSAQEVIPEPEWQWEKPDGSLDMDALLKEFQKFWRKNSEIWEQKSDYTEAFPHLLLMAFLQRVLNGGGRIEREYAAGRGRMDLAVEYKNRVFIIEIKLIHSYDTPADIHDEGLGQIQKYRDKTDANASAYLVIFDRRDMAKSPSWDEKIYWKEEAVPGGTVAVLGC